MSGKKFPKKGDVYWAKLDPTVGSEIQKTRPVLVVSNDVANEYSKLVMIAPITSKVKNVHSFEVQIVLKGNPAKILLNQCRAVDKTRLDKKIAEVDADTLKQAEEAIKIVFGIN